MPIKQIFINFFYIASLLSFFIVSCKTTKFPNFYEESSIWKDAGEENKNNYDNKIFISNRTLRYNISFKDSTGKKLKLFIFNELCKSDSSNKCHNFKLTPINYKKRNNEYEINNFTITVYRNNTEVMKNIASTQTIVNYSFFNNNKIINRLSSLTGIIEDSSQIYMHPPRSGYFEILEFFPFPKVYFPLSIGKSWSSKLSVPNHFFKYSNIENKAQVVLNSYRVTEKIFIETSDGKKECWKIDAVSQSDIGENKASFYYSTTIGFIKMVFIDTNGKQLIFDISKI